MKSFFFTISFALFSCIIVSCSDSKSSLIEDVDEFYQSGRSFEMLKELWKKYPNKPRLGNDTVGKMITEHYGEVHLECRQGRDAMTDKLIRFPCSIKQFGIKEGTFLGYGLEIKEVEGAVWHTAYFWEMLYNRKTPLDSLQGDKKSEVGNWPRGNYTIEPVKFQRMPLKWFKVYWKEPYFDKFQMYINYVTLLDDRLFIQLSFREMHTAPQTGMQTKESDVEKVLQTAINWEWLKTMNLTNQNR
jgi:hypothetical protein